MQFRTTVTFEDLGGGRTRVTLHGVFPSAAERDRVVEDYGADKGAMQTLARLADYVGKLASVQSLITVSIAADEAASGAILESFVWTPMPTISTNMTR